MRRLSVPDSAVRSVGRYACTTPLRTALDIARHEDLPESVVALDVLLARGLVHPGPLAEAAGALPAGRGTRRARRAVALAPQHRIAIEYDGAWHEDPGQLARDRRRLNALQASGWTVLHVTATDMHGPDALIDAVCRLVATRESGVRRSSVPAVDRISPRSAAKSPRDRATRS